MVQIHDRWVEMDPEEEESMEERQHEPVVYPKEAAELL